MKKKRAAMPGAGRPARSGDGASSTMSLRLSATERARLQTLAAVLGGTEADAMRRGLAELAERHGVD